MSSFATLLQSRVDSGLFSGAVYLVADRERVLEVVTVGLADIATGRPMAEETLFWVASMTKPVTGAAFMILVDEGKVQVDDPVSLYIPEFARLQVLHADGTLAAPRRPILVRDLLCHTSGLRFLNTKDNHLIDSVPLKTSIEHNLLEPLVAEPGTTYLYSNEGTDTAGRIIEIVSGIPYETFLQERLFTPLGMPDTTFFPDAAQLARLAKTYSSVEGVLTEKPIHYLSHPLDRPDRYPAPGGGLFSTARDMARFCQMLANGGTFEGKTYLSPEAVRQMTVKQTPTLVPNAYGFAIGAPSLDGKGFGHGGAYRTVMGVDHGQVRVYMVQQAEAPPDPEIGPALDAEARRLYPVSDGPAAATSWAPVGAQIVARP
ncbi:CubicO group peptidase, beta-lactamase class C family [Verrucomicrobium sp. GAS474]|uniref:serine hydrolase domain-containing protein n=1 Tax=Verrucomicrobium sp. GAS474 TaxID=1882831 RepID=UPI0008798CFC|nr:serine hydrolase domain-containing protein [Verrucomicrobium sp. GAS474]SDU03971.1 CubicO group peptidase, beta-lactamase class C family [Verrucomicrobium sp. GAS474]